VGSRKFLVAILAWALLTANVYCLAQCAEMPNGPASVHSSPPPCHRHQPTQQNQEPAGCKHSVLLAEHRTVSPDNAPLAAILTSPLAGPAGTITPVLAGHFDTRPPVSPELHLSTLLRI
jgi:hypothetical protein